MRRLSAVLVALLAVTVLAGLAPPAFAAPVTYLTPVDGPVVDPFRPPRTTYGAGNRGLTYATTDGSAVRAAAPGRVTFAGSVGGALHVVVEHRDGVRTSYSFLRSFRPRVGAAVSQGQTVGTTGKSFHFGARIGDAYIDPAILLESGPARVHLVPDGEFREAGAADDVKAMWSTVADWVSASASAIAWARDAGITVGGAAVDAATFAAGATVDAFGQMSRAAIEHYITWLDSIVNMGQMAGPFAAMASAMADVLQAFVEACTSPDVAKPKVAGTRVVVFVAGLGSSSNGPDDPHNLSKRLRAKELYGDDVVAYDFSYNGGRAPEPYQASDTVQDLRKSASELRDLLDQIARHHPGVPVDVIAHSQGGLVAREALAHDYDSDDHLLPPVGHFVTLGTPHHGADAATMNAWLRWTAGGRAVRALIGDDLTDFDINGKSLAQLSETSDFVENINNRSLREGVAYTSIGAAGDLIVPAVRARLAGASNVLVDTGSPMASHTGLTTSESAHRELALAVSDRPPTCQPLISTARRAATGAGIATTEDLIGLSVADAFAP